MASFRSGKPSFFKLFPLKLYIKYSFIYSLPMLSRSKNYCHSLAHSYSTIVQKFLEILGGREGAFHPTDHR